MRSFSRPLAFLMLNTWRVSPMGTYPMTTIDARFAIVLAQVLDFKRDPGKNQSRILEVETSIRQCLCSLGRIEGYPHGGYCNYNNLSRQ